LTVQTWELHIAPPECKKLLAAATLGRLGVIVNGRPEIFPVNHVYDDASGCVVFPSNGRTKMHAALDWPWVSYEVDGVEPDDGGAWSVTLVGHAEEITDLEEITRAARARKVLWAAGDAVHWIRIVPTKISGRRISAAVQT
jgi:nitroimidazol reductase NimA-like FMN-containing flavoprotein (pyridoxamine 5'-phosphate oxidase superfamily)